ncbi:MAG TPA: hypothetical protein VF761_16890 [Gemmatimonadaceae bacterium]
MTFTGAWEPVGDPINLTERQAVPGGWLVRVWAANIYGDSPLAQVTGIAGKPVVVGVSVTFVPDAGYHWKIEPPSEEQTA